MNGSTSVVRLRSCARTSVGQVRENNEDSVHLWSNDHFVLAVVADGMGGAAAGEEASRIAVEAVREGLLPEENADKEYLDSLSDEFIIQKLRETIRAGNLNIVRRAASVPELRGMGTTMTLALVRGVQAVLAHVGDSRAYLVKSGKRSITQITSDHSFVEALIAGGYITHEQAEDHPMRNVLYRALGQAEDLEIDTFTRTLSAGDRLVLCSDGLTRHVKAQEIANLVTLNDDPEVACEALIDLANARGGEDNISVVLIYVDGEDAPLLIKNDDSTSLDVQMLRLDEEDTLHLDVSEPPNQLFNLPYDDSDPDDTLVERD